MKTTLIIPKPIQDMVDRHILRTGLNQSECIRAALLEYLQRHDAYFENRQQGEVPAIAAVPTEPRTIFVERSPEPPPMRLREPHPLQRMTPEEKAALIERIARGGVEKEKIK